ncbi:MAG: TetR family transcriptional regulator [Xanthomonadaceae bacterium]|jgi:AcrR family transcriptional regulator|nr:TetR family transcriptional regulator [Xanthomonadaceae bacterium]
MSKSDPFPTRDRILGAAEELFAAHGFAGTSLRQVTRRANVNIAAVNYYFGSKENLINEVFRRRMDELSSQRMTLLEAARRERPGALEPILAAFIEPALALAQNDDGDDAFIRVVARVYAEHAGNLRQFLSEQYGHVLRSFSKAIAECLPALGKDELYWRLDFLTGALTYIMADSDSSRLPPDTDPSAYRNRAAKELIQFTAAGFQAASPTSLS